MANLCYLGFNLENHINIKYCLTGKSTKNNIHCKYIKTFVHSINQKENSEAYIQTIFQGNIQKPLLLKTST